MSTLDGRTATKQQPIPSVITGPECANYEHCSAHTRPPHRMSAHYTLIWEVVKSLH
jgi:hypothetical protein